jgi:hypothetical protein
MLRRVRAGNPRQLATQPATTPPEAPTAKRKLTVCRPTAAASARDTCRARPWRGSGRAARAAGPGWARPSKSSTRGGPPPVFVRWLRCVRVCNHASSMGVGWCCKQASCLCDTGMGLRGQRLHVQAPNQAAPTANSEPSSCCAGLASPAHLSGHHRHTDTSRGPTGSLASALHG